MTESSAGYHGLATASVCSKFGLPCTIYMSREDYAKVHVNMFKMEQFGSQPTTAWKSRTITGYGWGPNAEPMTECVVFMFLSQSEKHSWIEVGPHVRQVGRSSVYAIQECFSDWERNIKTTHFVMGSALGPHPYPVMVRDFQAVVDLETRNQA
ncbi:hypothetical protein LXL04_039628 [Taraxacum kok-saghyz]